MLLLNPFRFGGWSGNPQTHDNVVAHWDYSDAGSITKVPASEQVETIADGSTNSNDFKANASGRGPFIVSVDGKDMGRFVAFEQSKLEADHHASLDFGSGSMTYVCVISSEGYADHDGHFLVKGIGGAASGAWYGRINQAGKGGFIPLFGAFGSEKFIEDDKTGTVTNRRMIITVVFDKGTDTCRYYKNGVEADGSGFSLTSSGSPDSSEVLIVGRQQPATGAFGTFDIGETGIMNSALSSGEVAKMHAFLKSKWSIDDAVSPGHSPATDPVTFAGRIGDWDFSDDASITEVSNKISQIDDAEATNDLLQTTASKRPIKAFFAGKQMGFFGEDGTNSDDLSTEGVSAPTNLADIGTNSVLYIGVFHVLRDVVSADNGNTLFISGENNVNHARMFVMLDNDDGIMSSVAESSSSVNVVDNAVNPLFRTVCYAMYINREAVPDELTLYFNGVETAVSGDDISTITPLDNVGAAEDGFIIGSLLPDTGGAFANKLRFEGGIGRLIVIEEALTTGEITEISKFLMNQFDITT